MILEPRLNYETKFKLEGGIYFLTEPEARSILKDRYTYLGSRATESKGLAISGLFQKMVDVRMSNIYENFVVPQGRSCGYTDSRIQELILYDVPVLVATVGLLYPEFDLLHPEINHEYLFMRSLLRIRLDVGRSPLTGASVTPLLMALKHRGVYGVKLSPEEFINRYAYAVRAALYKTVSMQTGLHIVELASFMTKSLFEVPIAEVQIANVLALIDVAVKQANPSVLRTPLSFVRSKFERLDKQHFQFDKQPLIDALTAEKLSKFEEIKEKLVNFS